VAAAAPLEVRDVKGEHFTLGGTQTMDLAGLDVILLRQDRLSISPISLRRICLNICSQTC